MMFIIGLNSWETWKIVEDGRKERVFACFAYCQKTGLPSLYFRICGAQMREIMRFWDNKLVPQTVCVNTRAPPALLS